MWGEAWRWLRLAIWALCAYGLLHLWLQGIRSAGG